MRAMYSRYSLTNFQKFPRVIRAPCIQRSSSRGSSKQKAIVEIPKPLLPSMPQDPFGAIFLLCEIGLIACFCKDKLDQVIVPQQPIVLVPLVQPAVVAASPVSQGKHVAGSYVQSSTGEVEFVPAGQSSPNTQPAPSRPYNAARVPPPRSPQEAGKSPTGQALCVPAVPPPPSPAYAQPPPFVPYTQPAQAAPSLNASHVSPPRSPNAVEFGGSSMGQNV